jgi:hypothetical protein
LTVAVVHLVWQPAGVAPFDAFLRSYAAHDSGCEHDLVLLFNGFEDRRSLAPFRERAGDLRFQELVLDERCLDLAAYAHAATVLGHDRLCFVNSYSEVAGPGWLALLEAALGRPGVGAAGATGSWASHLSYSLFQLGLPGAYADAFESRRAARTVMHELSQTPVPGAVRHWLYTLATIAWRLRASGRFPSPHLRTNGFLMDRLLFGELCRGPAPSKRATYRLESGPGSITARLRAAGRPPVVVDRQGVARHAPDWHESDGFHQAHQQDLLVTDNQTRLYTAATAAQRRVLSAMAWGPKARPA